MTEIVLPAAARDHIAKLDAAKRDRRTRRGIDQLPLESLLLSAGPMRYLLDDVSGHHLCPFGDDHGDACRAAAWRRRRPASLLTVGDPTYAEPQALEGYSLEIATSTEYRHVGWPTHAAARHAGRMP